MRSRRGHRDLRDSHSADSRQIILQRYSEAVAAYEWRQPAYMVAVPLQVALEAHIKALWRDSKYGPSRDADGSHRARVDAAHRLSLGGSAPDALPIIAEALRPGATMRYRLAGHDRETAEYWLTEVARLLDLVPPLAAAA